MIDLVKYTLVLIAAINAGLIVVPYLLRKSDLMTIKNFFLIGFTLYQVTSGYITLNDPFSFTTEITLGQPEKIATQYLIWIVVFEAVFLLSYRLGFGAKRLAKWTPVIRGEVREPVLWVFAFTLLGVAALLRLSVYIPYVAVISSHVGTSVAAVSAGLGAWVWARRPLNPAAAALMFGVLFFAIVIGITGEFGRRPIVAVAACLAWGTYYSRWRGLPPATVLVRAGIFGFIPLILVAKYTDVRGQFYGSTAGPFDRISQIAKGNTINGIKDLASGQECAAWSMWLMETHPDTFAYRPLHAVKYYFQLPVPRAIYPNKPETLAETAWRDAAIPGMPDGYSIGPGILGHAGSEGGFPALVLYAVVIGLFVRYFDSVLAKAPSQPFVALPIGASLGNMLGIARGETPNFAFEFTVGVLGSLLILFFVARVLRAMGLITQSDFVQYEDAEEEHDSGHLDTYSDPKYASYGSEPDTY